MKSYEQERGSFLDAFEGMTRPQTICGFGARSDGIVTCEKIAFSRRLADFEVTVGVAGDDVSEADVESFRNQISGNLDLYYPWTQVKARFVYNGQVVSTPRRIDVLIFDPHLLDDRDQEFVENNIAFPDFMFSKDRTVAFYDFMHSGDPCRAFSAVMTNGELIHSHVWVRGDSFSIHANAGGLGTVCAEQIPFIAMGLNLPQPLHIFEKARYADQGEYRKSLAFERVVLEIFYSDVISLKDGSVELRSKVWNAIKRECGIELNKP